LVPARALGRWKELEFLFDFPGAFRNYREAIAKTKPPVIPFLANYSKNLFGIEENNLVYIAGTSMRPSPPDNFIIGRSLSLTARHTTHGTTRHACRWGGEL
jgi:hypothetical protein